MNKYLGGVTFLVKSMHLKLSRFSQLQIKSYTEKYKLIQAQ